MGGTPLEQLAEWPAPVSVHGSRLGPLCPELRPGGTTVRILSLPYGTQTAAFSCEHRNVAGAKHSRAAGFARAHVPSAVSLCRGCPRHRRSESRVDGVGSQRLGSCDSVVHKRAKRGPAQGSAAPPFAGQRDPADGAAPRCRPFPRREQ